MIFLHTVISFQVFLSNINKLLKIVEREVLAVNKLDCDIVVNELELQLCYSLLD